MNTPVPPLELRVVGDTGLRHPATPVVDFGASLRELTDAMAAAMARWGGVGLAANQVGSPLSVFVLDVGDGLHVIANPSIVERHGVAHGSEGCLSIPGYRLELPRPRRVVVAGVDTAGRERTWEFTGLAARCACHEVDHLAGVLISDHA